MATPTASTSPKKHPSPHRHAVSLWVLFFGLMAGPAAWVLLHLIAYAISSRACFDGDIQRVTASSDVDLLRMALVAGSLAAVGLAGAGGLAAYRGLQATRGEGEPHGEGLLESGEGRSRFLAACGLFITALFLAAILADAVVLVGAPLCRG